MDSWQVLWENRVLWIGFSMIFLVVQTHLLYCMYEGENGVYIAVWPSCQTDDHQQDHIFCKGSWDTYYSKLHFPIVLSEGWSTCYPVPSLLGYCRCLQGFVCLSFLALVSILCHFNLLTKQKLDWPPLRNRRDNYNNYNNHKHNNNSRNCIQPLLVTPWTCLMEGQETLSNGPYSWKIHKSLAQLVPMGMAWAWGAQWFWMESADSLLHWTWRHLNYVSVLRTSVSVEVPVGGSFWLSWWSPKHPEPPYWYTRFPTSEAQLLSGIPKKRCEGRYNERPSFTMVSSSELHQWHSITIYWSP